LLISASCWAKSSEASQKPSHVLENESEKVHSISEWGVEINQGIWGLLFEEDLVESLSDGIFLNSLM
jgi:hypothetical protein